MKMEKIVIRVIVKIIKVLIANLWVLKNTTLVNITAIIATGMINGSKNGKKIMIIIVNTWAEKEHVAIFAIKRKTPIIKAEKPPMPSLLKLYAPPDIGKLVESSE